MAMPFSTTVSYVDTACSTYIQTGVSNMAQAIDPLAMGMLGIYILVWGFSHMCNLIQEPVTDAVKRFLKIAIILCVALDIGTYNKYITDTILSAPSDLAAVISGDPSAGTFGDILDKMFTKFWDLGYNFWSASGLSNGYIGFALAAIVCWGIGAVVTGYTAFLIILAKIGTALVVALGPLFILSALFESTKRFFEVWVQQLANFGIINVLVVGLNVLLFHLLDLYLASSQASGSSEVITVMPVVLISIVCVMMLGQMLGLASGLAGGVSLTTMGVGQWAARKMGWARQQSIDVGAKAAAQYVQKKVMRPWQSTAAIRKG